MLHTWDPVAAIQRLTKWAKAKPFQWIRFKIRLIEARCRDELLRVPFVQIAVSAVECCTRRYACCLHSDDLPKRLRQSRAVTEAHSL